MPCPLPSILLEASTRRIAVGRSAVGSAGSRSTSSMNSELVVPAGSLWSMQSWARTVKRCKAWACVVSAATLLMRARTKPATRR